MMILKPVLSIAGAGMISIRLLEHIRLGKEANAHWLTVSPCLRRSPLLGCRMACQECFSAFAVVMHGR